MKSVVFAALLSLTFTTVSTNPVLPESFIFELDTTGNCPTGYSQPANADWTSCYKVFTNFKTKKSAAAQCKAVNGTLASVSDSFVNSFLYYIASQNGATSLWLGTECFNGDSSNCVNDDKTPVIYSNFYPGQPNVDGTCVYMSTIGRDSQKWLSFDCEQKFQFACEVPAGGASVVSTTTASTTRGPTTTTTQRKFLACPTGYSKFQGMCYIKNNANFGNTRDQAALECQTVPEGNLATIPNLDVDQFIQNLPCNNPYIRIGLRCPTINFDGDTSSCVWDDGTPFTYNNFASQYPKANSQNPCIYELSGKWLNDGAEGCNVGFTCSLCQAPPM